VVPRAKIIGTGKRGLANSTSNQVVKYENEGADPPRSGPEPTCMFWWQFGSKLRRVLRSCRFLRLLTLTLIRTRPPTVSIGARCLPAGNLTSTLLAISPSEFRWLGRRYAACGCSAILTLRTAS
jgi:hypothetical protein